MNIKKILLGPFQKPCQDVRLLKSLKWTPFVKRVDIWEDTIPDILTQFSKGTIIIFFGWKIW
jgi:hypothetical protein